MINSNFYKQLWDKYNLPEPKRIHVTLVTQTALYFTDLFIGKGYKLNRDLVEAAAMLHDIDKNIPKLPGEHHPDAGVRILHHEGLPDVAELVKTHPLHSILDPVICPKSWEEKVLYLADKMVKYEIITVDERFKLWNDEHLPSSEQAILDACYPKVKALEREVFALLGIEYTQIHSSLRQT